MITLYDNDMRTIVDLPKEQLASLDELCRQQGISRAEGVRRAVQIYTRQFKPASGERAFGLWRHRKVDGRAYEDSLRDEWEPSS